MWNYGRIGQYEILAPLPRTGAARPFRAQQPSGEEVVLKLYPPYVRVDVPRVERIAEMLALFGSPVFVPLYDVGLWKQQFYIVSRWMPGGSLGDVLRQQGRLPVGQATQYLYRLALGLSGLHALGFQHENITPENILFDEEGEPCLADISLTRYTRVSPQDSLSLDLVDPRFASPEQVWGRRRVTRRSDVYALGAVYYAMLTGESPAGNLRGAQAILSVVHGSVVPVRKTAPAVPAPAARLLDKMLPNDPALRLPSMDAVIQQAEPLLPQTRASVIRTRAESERFPSEQLAALQADTAQTSRPRRGWLTALLVAILLVLAIAGGGVLALLQNGISPLALFGGAPSPSAVVAEAPTRTAAPLLSPSPTVLPAATFTPPPPLTPTGTPTGQPTATPTATPAPVVVGGVDKIAFVAQNDIWMANPDGSELERLTTDEAPKQDLQWAADGKHLLYTREGTVYSLDIASHTAAVTSPPVQNSRCTLHVGRLTRYRDDGRMAVTVVEVSAHGRREDVIQVYTFDENCNPDLVDAFPGDRFTLRGYSENSALPRIDEYAWDGRDTFILHGDVRHNGGDMVLYNLQTRKAEVVNPVEGRCCYRDIHFSADGSYVSFVFQDARYTKPAEIYYVPLATLSGGGRFEPLPFPSYFFDTLGGEVSLALRAYRPPVSANPTPEAGATPTGPTEVGGADKLALVVRGDIWVVNLNGQGARQLTHNGIDKAYLQWSPDGQYVLYEEADCLKAVHIATGNIISLGCYQAYGITRDGDSIILTDEVLFPDGLKRPLTSIVPFNLLRLKSLPNYTDLPLAGSCEMDVVADTYRWSPDGKRLAVLAETSAAGRKWQAVLVYELRACGEAPRLVDTFPANRFQVRGYSGEDGKPLLYDFAWNGENLFAINGAVHDGFGDFVLYDMSTGRAKVIDPLQKECCYREMRWSPDGTYLLFATEDPGEGIKLYYVPFESLDDKTALASLPLSPGFFQGADTRKRLYPALRPIQRNTVLPYGQEPDAAAELPRVPLSPDTQTTLSLGKIYALAFSPQGSSLAVGGERGLGVYDLNTRQVDYIGTSSEKHSGAVVGVAFSSDGSWLASASVDGSTRIWRVSTGAPFQKILLNEPFYMLAVDYDPDADLIASASNDFLVHVNQRNNAGTRFILQGHTAPVFAVRYAQDGAYLVTGSADRTVRVWSTLDGSPLQILSGHLDAVADVDFSPDNTLVASASWDGTVRVWDWQESAEKFVLYGHDAPVLGVRFFPQGGGLVSVDANGTLLAWRLSDGALVQQTSLGKSFEGAVAFSAGGNRLVIGASDGTIYFYTVDLQAFEQ